MSIHFSASYLIQASKIVKQYVYLWCIFQGHINLVTFLANVKVCTRKLLFLQMILKKLYWLRVNDIEILGCGIVGSS